MVIDDHPVIAALDVGEAIENLQKIPARPRRWPSGMRFDDLRRASHFSIASAAPGGFHNSVRCACRQLKKTGRMKRPAR
jgi:hypothetical protein